MFHAYVFFLQNQQWWRIDGLEIIPTPVNNDDWFWIQNCQEIYLYEWVDQCRTTFANQRTCSEMSLDKFCFENDIQVPEEIERSERKPKSCSKCNKSQEWRLSPYATDAAIKQFAQIQRTKKDLGTAKARYGKKLKSLMK